MRPVFDDVRASTPKTLAGIKKRVNIHELFGVTADAIRRFFRPEFARLDEYDDFHLAAIIETIGLFWVFIGDALFEELEQMMLKYMQHESGRVREAVRRVGEYVRTAPEETGMRGNSPVSREQYLIFLRKLAALIRSLRRDAGYDRKIHTEDEIRDLPSSPYKSTCMLWERVVMKDIYSNWISEMECEALEVWSPPAWSERTEDENDDEPFQDIVHAPFEEVRDALWKRTKESTREVGALLEKLEARSRTRFQKSVRMLGYHEKDFHAMCDTIATSGSIHSGEEILPRVYIQLRARNSTFVPDDMNDFVRALQSYMNNVLSFDQDLKPFSHLLVATIQQRDAYAKRHPRTFSDILRKLDDVHHETEELCAQYVPQVEKDFTHVLHPKRDEKISERHAKSVSAAHDIGISFVQRGKDEIQQMESIIHHIVDWLAQIEPWYFVGRDPRQLVVQLFFIVQKFNSNEDITVCASFDKKYLASHQNKKSVSTVQNNPLFELIVHSVRDQDLIRIIGSKKL